jgi:hypothetical protein
MPDYNAFHASLTAELYSVKDRIRNLVSHWPTDGESKEVALRSVLRKHLPSAVNVGRGFVVTKDRSSTQIDILVTDSSKPVLFREGDLMIVTPDAVLAIIEVKSEMASRPALAKAITKLTNVEDMCRDVTGRDSIWTGLFTFNEASIGHPVILGAVADAYAASRRPIGAISCGRNTFVRYWSRGADVGSQERGPVWHSYDIQGVAPSYFIGNLVDSISAVDESSAGYAWFPVVGGKEQHRQYFLPLTSTIPTRFPEAAPLPTSREEPPL